MSIFISIPDIWSEFECIVCAFCGAFNYMTVLWCLISGSTLSYSTKWNIMRSGYIQLDNATNKSLIGD